MTNGTQTITYVLSCKLLQSVRNYLRIVIPSTSSKLIKDFETEIFHYSFTIARKWYIGQRKADFMTPSDVLTQRYAKKGSKKLV